MKKILIPTDFSAHSKNAIAHGIGLANRFGATLTLFHTYNVSSSTGAFVSARDFIVSDAEREMEQLLESTKKQLLQPNKAEGFITEYDAIRGIVKKADSDKYDLIVMGTQGATGLKEIFFGSVTNGVLKKTTTPLLAIPKDYPVTAITEIVFAVDDLGVHKPDTILPLILFAKMLDASISVLHLDYGVGDLHIAPSIDTMLKGVEHSFHNVAMEGNDISANLDRFVAEQSADVLCMIRRKKSIWEQAFFESSTTQEVFHSRVPLLVLHE